MRYIPHETFRLCRFGHFPRHPHCAERSFDRHQDREWDVQRPIHGIMMRFLLSRILDKRLCDQVRISSVRPVVGCGVMPCIAYHIQQYYITQSHRSTWYGDPWHSLRHLARTNKHRVSCVWRRSVFVSNAYLARLSERLNGLGIKS